MHEGVGGSGVLEVFEAVLEVDDVKPAVGAVRFLREVEAAVGCLADRGDGSAASDFS